MFDENGESDAKKIGLNGEVIYPLRGNDALTEFPQSGHHIR